METRIIKTPLVGRDETFNQLAVAEAIQLPILLKGVPGLGKTKALLDYAKAFHNHDFAKTVAETFILETDEGSRPSEIKGRMNIKKLVTENEYAIQAPIAEASFILINEIDKASAGLRNSMLGVMNEKYVFNGTEKIPCDWNVFAASCNTIPEEEKDSPFWDRFVIKHNMERISQDQHLGYFDSMTDGTNIREIEIHVPSQDEIEAMRFAKAKLSKFIDITYSKLSDRTLSYVPRLAAAVALVYGFDQNKALIKTADILLGYDMATSLANTLESKAVIQLRGQIDMLGSLPSMQKIQDQIAVIKTALGSAIKSGDISQEELPGFLDAIKRVVSNNPAAKKAAAQQDAVAAEEPAVTPF